MDQTKRDLIVQAAQLNMREEFLVCRDFDGVRLIQPKQFESCISTGAVINSGHIEPRQFLEDARKIVLERVQSVIHKKDNIKINTVFNGEFVSAGYPRSRYVDCGKLNDCAIGLPSEDNKWLSFSYNHCKKERILFMIYANLECTLEKTEREYVSI
ncbi:hypothetical protein G5I_10710 [Acromyrmex echinatior]|uniref:Uncharacterized protein n=1 Tax=Acromyrmex echinatior TaxID=103372 RepID=F4WXM5_ACREC|nr:hypothetical protein G5I_10710 [Acromyrmex echinatior]